LFKSVITLLFSLKNNKGTAKQETFNKNYYTLFFLKVNSFMNFFEKKILYQM